MEIEKCLKDRIWWKKMLNILFNKVDADSQESDFIFTEQTQQILGLPIHWHVF